MATSSKDTMTKLAAMERGAANINRLIVENLRNYSNLNVAVQQFLANPGDETATVLDERFDNCEQGFEAVRAAVANVAVVAMDAEIVDAEGKLAIGGTEDEDGIRLS